MSIRKRIDKIEKRIGLSQSESLFINMMYVDAEITENQKQNAKKEVMQRFPDQDIYILMYTNNNTCEYDNLVMHFDKSTGEVIDIREKH